MADNVTLKDGAAAEFTAAADDIAGVKYQVVKLALGAPDAVDTHLDSGQQTKANSVPVTLASDQGALAVSGPLTDTELRAAVVPVSVGAALPAGDNNIGNVDIVTLPALVAGTANIGDVDILTVPADPFGANADAASATGSLSAKLRYLLNTIADAAGLWARLFPGRAALKSGTASATATTSTSLIAGTASNYLYVTSVTVWNSSATDTRVTLQDGSGGTSLYVVPAPKAGGAIITFTTPLLVPTVANGIFFATADAVTTMYVSATGYISTV